MANYYYSGQGSLLMATRSVTGAPEGFIKIGNVPELSIDIEVTKFEHKESESGSRLIDLVIVQEKKGTFSLKVESLSLDNLAVGFWGDTATVAGGTVAAGAEIIAVPMGAKAGTIFPLAHPRVSSVTVTGPSGTPTRTLGTDYDLDAANGTIAIKGGIVTSAASAATTMEVGYTYAGYTKLDAFTNAVAPERWLRFQGLNTVNNDLVIVDLYRAQFDPMTGYALINPELGTADLKGSLLADPLRVTGSKFFGQKLVPAV